MKGEKEILALTAMPETLSKKKKTKRNEENNKKYEWKKVALKDLKNGKKYHWCIKHQMWTLHKPDNCKLEEREAEQQEEKDDGLKLTAALEAFDDNEESVE